MTLDWCSDPSKYTHRSVPTKIGVVNKSLVYKHNWQHFHKNKILSNLLLKRDLVIRLVRVCRLQARAKMSDKFDSHAIQTCVDDLLTNPLIDDEASLGYALKYRCLLVFRLNLIGWTWPLQHQPILCYAVIGFCILTQNWRTQYSSGETFPAAY